MIGTRSCFLWAWGLEGKCSLFVGPGRRAIPGAAQELDGLGGQLEAGPCHTIIPRPNARVLVAVNGLALDRALDKDLPALVHELVHGLGQAAPAGDVPPGRKLIATAIVGLFLSRMHAAFDIVVQRLGDVL